MRRRYLNVRQISDHDFLKLCSVSIQSSSTRQQKRKPPSRSFLTPRPGLAIQTEEAGLFANCVNPWTFYLYEVSGWEMCPIWPVPSHQSTMAEMRALIRPTAQCSSRLVNPVSNRRDSDQSACHCSLLCLRHDNELHWQHRSQRFYVSIYTHGGSRDNETRLTGKQSDELELGTDAENKQTNF